MGIPRASLSTVLRVDTSLRVDTKNASVTQTRRAAGKSESHQTPERTAQCAMISRPTTRDQCLRVGLGFFMCLWPGMTPNRQRAGPRVWPGPGTGGSDRSLARPVPAAFDTPPSSCPIARSPPPTRTTAPAQRHPPLPPLTHGRNSIKGNRVHRPPGDHQAPLSTAHTVTRGHDRRRLRTHSRATVVIDGRRINASNLECKAHHTWKSGGASPLHQPTRG